MSPESQPPVAEPPRILSVRQPWAFAIARGWKPIENRSWPTDYRGPLLIHASKFGALTAAQRSEQINTLYTTFQQSEVLTDWSEVARAAGRAGIELPFVSARELFTQCGGIVARCRLVDIIQPGGMSLTRGYPSKQAAYMRHHLADSPWYHGEFGWVLSNVEPVPFVPLAGALGLVTPKGRNLELLQEAGLA